MRVDEARRMLLEKLDSTDTRIILRLATGLDDIHQITEGGIELSSDSEERIHDLAEKRLNGTPMAYIMGEKEFYGLPFRVSGSVLIPRPDTETLVDTAIELAAGFPDPAILDLCTGSGAIGTAIAHTLSRAVALSDISEDAIAIARENYRKNTGMEADARTGNLFDPWTGSRFDIIASNPPYLTDIWYEETDKDVKAEPIGAFIGGGEDGLDIIREIIEKSPEYLSPNGCLVLECDYRQTEICGRLLETAGFSDIASRKDLAGRERVVYGRRNSK